MDIVMGSRKWQGDVPYLVEAFWKFDRALGFMIWDLELWLDEMHLAATQCHNPPSSQK